MTALERHYVSVIDPSLAPTPEILVKDPAMEMALRIFRHAVSTYGLPPDHKALSRDENARKIYGFWNQQHFETFVNGVFRAGVVQTPFERRGERGALRNIYTLTPLAAEALFALGFMMLEEAKETKGRSSPKKKGWRHFVQKTKERLGENHPVSAILHEPSRPLKPSKKDMIEEQQEQEQGDEEEKRKPILIKISVIRIKGSRPVPVGFTDYDLAQLAGYNMSSLERSATWTRKNPFSDDSFEKLGMTNAIAVAILEVYNFVRQKKGEDLISFDELLSNLELFEKALYILARYFKKSEEEGISQNENNLLLLFQRVLQTKERDGINTRL